MWLRWLYCAILFVIGLILYKLVISGFISIFTCKLSTLREKRSVSQSVKPYLLIVFSALWRGALSFAFIVLILYYFERFSVFGFCLGIIAGFLSPRKYPSNPKSYFNTFWDRFIFFFILLIFFTYSGMPTIGALIESNMYDQVCYATVKSPVTNNFESKARISVSAYYYAPHRELSYEIEWISLNCDNPGEQKTFHASWSDRTTIKNVFDWQTFTDKYGNTWQVRIHRPGFSYAFNIGVLLFTVYLFFFDLIFKRKEKGYSSIK